MGREGGGRVWVVVEAGDEVECKKAGNGATLWGCKETSTRGRLAQARSRG